MSKENIVLIYGLVLMAIGILFAVAYGSSSGNMTLDCIRMFYSDEWNHGYVEDLAQFCHNKK